MAFDVSNLHFSALPAVAFNRCGCNWTFALGCVTQMASLKMHAPRDRVEFIGKLVLLVFVLGAPGQLLRGAKPVNQHDVLPILHLRCAACHGRQEQKAGLDLRTVESLLKGSKDGPVLKSSDPDGSLLIQKITKGEMPPKRDLVKASVKPVRDVELEIIRDWVTAGMPLAESERPREPLISEQDRQFWSFQSPKRPEVPLLGQAAAANPIDLFVAKRLAKTGLKLAGQASKRELARRIYFDLIGLPPLPEEVDAFVVDVRPDAYEQLVDRLLASPAYGERWARYWLDLAGYADSEGIQHADTLRPWAYRYRDYVIRALNLDKPYDLFLSEQIAGDELANYQDADEFSEEHLDRLVATGFLRMVEDGTNANITNFVPDRQDNIDNEMRVLGSSVLGLTLHCAKCHSHKFDPLSQADYFRLRAIFKGAFDEHDWLNPAKRRLPFGHPGELKRWHENKATVDAEVVAIKANEGLDEEAKKKALEVTEKKRIEQPMVRALWDRGQPSPTYLFNRGDDLQPRELIEPGLPRALVSPGETFRGKPPWQGSGKTGRRLALANWLTKGVHPLTARVMVNRLWKHHFGRGLVRTLGDFGKAGERPSHPQLLDWLATEFVEAEWSIKRMHRLILTSRTYRQTSRVSAERIELDPQNKLWSRMPLLRLQGEVLRDSMLALAGRLRWEQFGPADPVDVSGQGLVMSKPKDGTWRRSVYLRQRRTEVPTLLASFDLPVMSPNCIERPESNVVTQALHLMNNELLRRLANAFARRVSHEKPGGIDGKMRHAFRLALGRNATTEEIDLAKRKLGPLANHDKTQLLQVFCHALFNAAEFAYVD